MTKRMAVFALLALLAAGAKADVGAVAPGTINFQARLARKEAGAMVPLVGIQHVAFRLYDAAEGGDLVWAREFPVTCTADGTFNLLLDDGGAILGEPAHEKLVDAFQGTERYFELEVEDVGTLAPRMRVPTAPYAFRSQYALWGEGGFEVGGSLSVADDARFEGRLTAASGTVGSLAVTNGAGSAGSLSVAGKVTVPEGKTNEAKGVVPVGGILAWPHEAGDVPDGWAVCDGENGTPDLRGWFVMGADGDHAPGTTGGENAVTLSAAQMPAHTHGYTYPSGTDAGSGYLENDDGHVWRNGKEATTASAGGGEAHENRPPFYALYFIMRLR